MRNDILIFFKIDDRTNEDYILNFAGSLEIVAVILMGIFPITEYILIRSDFRHAIFFQEI